MIWTHSLVVFLITVFFFFNHHLFIICLVSLQFASCCRGWMWCKERQYVFTRAQKRTFKLCYKTRFFFFSLLATWIIWIASLPQTTSPQNRTCCEFDSQPRVSTTTPSPSRPSHWGDQVTHLSDRWIQHRHHSLHWGKKYYWLSLRLCLFTCVCVYVCVC